MRLVAWACTLLLSGWLTLASAQGLLVPEPRDLQWSHPLARGLLHWWVARPPLLGGYRWWPFAGTIAGTLNYTEGTGGWYRPDRPGPWTAAMYFNGWRASGVFMDNPTLFNFENMTFTVALRFHCTTGSVGTYLVSKNELDVRMGWFILVESGALTGRLYDGTNISVQRTTTTTGLCSGVYATAVVVFTTDTTVGANNDVTIYLNGVLDSPTRVTTANLPYVAHPTAPLTLGSIAIGETSILLGSMDDIRIWNRGLSSAEAVMYDRALPPTFDGLLAPPEMNPAEVTVATKRRIAIH